VPTLPNAAVCRVEITDADRAVLTLKTQRRKLANEQKRLESLVAREMQVSIHSIKNAWSPCIRVQSCRSSVGILQRWGQ
jgi:hypothetical protein